MKRLVALTVVAIATFTSALIGSGCPIGGQCDCVACGNAVTLSVVDENDDPLQDFSVEATVDGNAVEDFGACDAANRNSNTCSFGTELGVYHVVIRAPRRPDKEVAARFAAKTGQDCCQQCIANAVVKAAMEPEQ